jgi:histidinol-phosphate aminotransferase
MFSIETLTRKSILELKPYTSARDDYKGNTGIFLDANENPFGKLNRYPDTDQNLLKEKVSELKGLPARHIFLGNGSNEAIDLIYRIFCDPGNCMALTFSPTYGMYSHSAAINNTILLTHPLDRNFQLDRVALAPILTLKKLKIIFVCSPNNPSGNSIDDIQFILDHFKGIVVIDEAYIDFSSKPTWLEKLGSYPNLIVLQTFSKAWGLASARVGMAFAQEEIISLFNKVRLPYNISTLNQQAAIAALSDPDRFQKRLNIILTERELLIQKLRSFSFIEQVYHTDANFVLIRLREATACYDYLTNKNIIVRNRSNIINDCLRITIGNRAQNNTLIKTLKRYATEKSTLYR